MIDDERQNISIVISPVTTPRSERKLITRLAIPARAQAALPG